MASLADPTRAAKSADILGHPRGLVTLAGTELWERISFHGMLALLTLYMAEQLLLPGHIEHVIGFAAYRAAIESVTGRLSTEALAAQTFGLYIGLMYFVPVFGGLIGDRVIGRRAAVVTGALLMAFGHFCMAFDDSFLLALLLLILGGGFLRGNLIAQVGQLYPAGDARCTNGIQIYYAMVNLGAFFAPIVTGTLSQSYGWHYGFGFAGMGMIVGILVYLVGLPNVPTDTPHHERAAVPPLTSDEWRTIAALVLLLPILAMFWVCNSQSWNVYNLWVRDRIDLSLFGWHIPVAWTQSLSAIWCVILVPVVLIWWRVLRVNNREPDALGKMAIGCLIFMAGNIWDATGTLIFGLDHQIPLVWIVFSTGVIAFGYLHVQPVAIALFARTAPPSVKSMMVGVYFLSIFAGSLISGRLGVLYEPWSATAFWLLHAAIIGTGGLLFLLLGPVFRRHLHEL